MTKNINFPDYESDPHTILNILRRCNTSTSKDEFSNIPQKDLDKLVEMGFLKEVHNSYEIPADKSNLYINQHKALTIKLYDVIKLRKNILQLNLAWIEFCDLIQSICNKCSNRKVILEINDEDNLRIEYYAGNVVSMVSKIRDSLKKSFIHVQKITDSNGIVREQITKKLVDKYSHYQSKYNELLKDTIEKESLIGLSDFLRNRMLHGGSMMYFISYKSRFINNQHYMIASALCDYGMLEKSTTLKKNYKHVKDNLHKYYADMTIVTLKDIINNSYNCDKFSENEIQIINSDLHIRQNNKNIDIRKMNSSSIKSLLKNKEFVLFMYNQWKKKNIPSLGQFSFDLSTALGDVYKAHIKLYETLYNWVLMVHNKEIKEIQEVHELLTRLESESLCAGGKMQFTLNLKDALYNH